jgi:hypothetical protein
MFKVRSGAVLFVCLMAIAAHLSVAADDFTDMPDDKGRLEVFVQCSLCHSMQIVNQQGLSRDAWKKLLVWMVDEQEMTEMDSTTELLVLDYLSKHYSPETQKDRLRNRGLLP